jgi:hypothetical protein
VFLEQTQLGIIPAYPRSPVNGNRLRFNNAVLKSFLTLNPGVFMKQLFIALALSGLFLNTAVATAAETASQKHEEAAKAHEEAAEHHKAAAQAHTEGKHAEAKKHAKNAEKASAGAHEKSKEAAHQSEKAK